MNTFGLALRAARQRAGLLPIELWELGGRKSGNRIPAIERGDEPAGRALIGELAMALADYGEDPDELCRAANRLAPDLEAWLLARPAVVAQIRQRMNRGKKEVA